MDPTGFPASSSWPTSMSGPGPVPDRPDTELDRPEAVLLSKPSGMVLRSHSRGHRKRGNSSWKTGGAPRPEPEIARPEVEFAPVAGPSSDPTAVGTKFPGPPTRCGTETIEETLSGYPFPARQEPEIAQYPSHPSTPCINPAFSIV